MKIGVILLNFGEPEHATMEEVVPFLERIFSINSSLERHANPEQARARARQLAEQRAPGLVAEYREIGGSPLLGQARDQAEALAAALVRRGHDPLVLLGMQFTEPSIPSAVAEARDAGVKRLIGLPVYPLCGPSTTVAALEQMCDEVRALDWSVETFEVTGWHRHPGYLELRADAVRRVLEENALSLKDPRTRLLFSAHGTPVKYIEEGSRYDLYVRDFCSTLAKLLEAPEYVIGYQNHGNRPGVRWTQPDVDRVVAELDADRVVVDAVSFMHEQSETLAELDRELREQAESRGLDFHRVPIPWSAPAFIEVLADLVEPFARPEGPPAPGDPVDIGGVPLRQCLCKPSLGARCLNAGVEA